MSKPRILAFAGSARKASFNKQVLKIAAKGAEEAGADVTVIDLADYPLPIMDEDLESAEGLPENARKLKQLFLEHDGLLLACPEYNSSITPLLKNVIDWVSRAESKDETPLACYQGKVAGLVSASPGALGGLRGLVHVRAILGNIQVLVIPDQAAVGSVFKVLDGDGNLTDDGQRARLMNVGNALAEALKKLTAHTE